MSSGRRKQAANRHMLDTLRPDDVRGQIGFFCECDEPTCYRVAWLSQDEYTALRAQAARPLAAAHTHARGRTGLTHRR